MTYRIVLIKRGEFSCTRVIVCDPKQRSGMSHGYPTKCKALKRVREFKKLWPTYEYEVEPEVSSVKS